MVVVAPKLVQRWNKTQTKTKPTAKNKESYTYTERIKFFTISLRLIFNINIIYEWNCMFSAELKIINGPK